MGKQATQAMHTSSADLSACHKNPYRRTTRAHTSQTSSTMLTHDKVATFLALLLTPLSLGGAFQSIPRSGFSSFPPTAACGSRSCTTTSFPFLSTSARNGNADIEDVSGDNKAMQFLKQIGKVGGTANRDFRYAMGVDEGPSGKSAGRRGGGLHKVKEAFRSCVESGIVDDMSEAFPETSSGTRWSGFT